MLGNKNNIIVSVGDDGAIVTCFSSGKLVNRIFVSSPFSSDFTELVNQYKKFPITMILDSIDQNYVYSNLPAVGSKNVSKIIKRKIENEFDPNDINTYICQGKEEGSVRKDLKYVFISIRNASPLTDWVEVLQEVENPFKGFYLYPVEAQNFIEKIRKTGGEKNKPVEDSQWEILISYNRVGGIRQVVLKDKKLIFTRISQATGLQTPDSIGVNISQEAANTMEYIRRIGYTDQTINVYLISSKESFEHIDIVGIDEENIYKYSPFEISERLKLKKAALENDKFGDVIFAASFVNSKKMLKLNTGVLNNLTNFNLANNAAKYSGFIIATGVILFSLFLFYKGFSLSSKIDDFKMKTSRVKSNLSQLEDFEKKFGIDESNIIQSMDIYEELHDKDQFIFDIIKTYNDADEYSTKITDYRFTNTGRRKFNFTVSLSFDLSGLGSYGDLLFITNQYKDALEKAFPDFDIKYNNMPSEDDINIDFDNSENSERRIVTIISGRK